MKITTSMILALSLIATTACDANASKKDANTNAPKASENVYNFSKDAPFYDIDSKLVFEGEESGSFCVIECDLGIGGAEMFYLYRTGDRTFDAFKHMQPDPSERLRMKRDLPKYQMEVRKVGTDNVLIIKENGKIVRAKVECKGKKLKPEQFLQRGMIYPFIGEYSDVNFPDQQHLVISNDGKIDGFFVEKPTKLVFEKDFFDAIRPIISFKRVDNPSEKAYFGIDILDDPKDNVVFTPYDRVTDREDLERAGETGDWAFIPSEGTPFFPQYQLVKSNHKWLHEEALSWFVAHNFHDYQIKEFIKELEAVKDKNDYERWNLELLKVSTSYR